MAIHQQPPTGGLNAVAPRPAAPAAGPAAPPQPPKNENLAARAAGMEQEQPDTAEDYFTKTLEERRAQSAALMAQIEKLKSSLDSRKGLPFDPVMMAGAAGFLKPTKTGSFGESLGYAADTFPPIFLDGTYTVELQNSASVVQSGWPVNNVGGERSKGRLENYSPIRASQLVNWLPVQMAIGTSQQPITI